MTNLQKATNLLHLLNVPERQQSELCAYTILALAGLKPRDSFANAKGEWMRIHDIITFIADNYKKNYAENSRETFRKKAIHHFRNAAFIEDNGKATNSPEYRYRLTEEFLGVIRNNNQKAVDAFLAKHESLISKYSSKRKMTRTSVTVNGNVYRLSVGQHNRLQKAVIEEFGSRFAPGAECLYLGDTTNKDLVKDEEKLHLLGFEITLHDKMPDVVLYCEKRKWIYFIEAVTSVGPMSPKRVLELKEMTKNVTCGIIYVTAFPDMRTFKRFASELAWDTEAWIAEIPEHMIHLNGDRFIGPRM